LSSVSSPFLSLFLGQASMEGAVEYGDADEGRLNLYLRKQSQLDYCALPLSILRFYTSSLTSS
jgi:hypothetical protein